jgi:hypothetical protein
VGRMPLNTRFFFIPSLAPPLRSYRHRNAV